MLSHFFNSLVATLPLAVRNSGGVAVFVRILWVATLLTMSISPRIIISVTFQKVDHAPDAKTGSEGNDEGLQHIDCAIEEIHILCAGIVSFWFCSGNRKAGMSWPLCAAVDSGFSFQIFGCAFLRLCVSPVSLALSASSFTEWVSDLYIKIRPFRRILNLRPRPRQRPQIPPPASA